MKIFLFSVYRAAINRVGNPRTSGSWRGLGWNPNVFLYLFLLFTRPRFLILHGGITITPFSDENGNIPKLLKERVERGENIMNKIAKIAALAALALTSYILC